MAAIYKIKLETADFNGLHTGIPVDYSLENTVHTV